MYDVTGADAVAATGFDDAVVGSAGFLFLSNGLIRSDGFNVFDWNWL